MAAPPGSRWRSGPGSGSGKGRVLVVDDNQASRRLLELHLTDSGFQVLTAESGERCLELAATEGPEVILLDIQMPGMDGIETCRRLKQDPDTQHVPILFVTNFSDDEPTAIEALGAGGNDLIAKDCSQEILAVRVASQVAIFRSHEAVREMAMDQLGPRERGQRFDDLVEWADMVNERARAIGDEIASAWRDLGALEKKLLLLREAVEQQQLDARDPLVRAAEAAIEAGDEVLAEIRGSGTWPRLDASAGSNSYRSLITRIGWVAMLHRRIVSSSRD
jgi:CheY-like chemotaxis protein